MSSGKHSKSLAVAIFVLLALNLAMGCVNIAQGAVYRSVIVGLEDRITKVELLLHENGMRIRERAP